MTYTLIVLACGIACGVWYYSTYNSLIRAQNSVDQTWSNVEVELQRRLDLIENLVSVVKGYAAHENKTLVEVVKSRAQVKAAPVDLSSAAAANTAEKQTLTDVGRIMALAEAYPVLMANEQFLNLQTELATTENRIAERRGAYNQTVNMYVNYVRLFPSNLVAASASFKERAFFDAPDELVGKVPEVRLA